MRYDAATRYVKTVRVGDAEYYAGRKWGTVTVSHDSKIYVYRFPKCPDVKAAKRALQEVFFHEGQLRGRWPEYRIE